jgi:general transcription factor 3C polypeptide 3 (transcription factor C subunit 4)
MFAYYEVRKHALEVEKRQEAHYNMGRVYNIIGQTNLAIPYYNLVFKEAESEDGSNEIVVDAAYNLQTIYTVAGNEALANAITEKYLVL